MSTPAATATATDRTTAFAVTGMSCGHCENAIREEVEQVAGVTEVSVSAASGRLVVAHDAATNTANTEASEADFTAAIIAAVAVLNAAVGLIQEGKAIRALDALKEMTRLTALVRRGGIIREIDAKELVPGDRVILTAGCRIPADLRLTVAENRP